MNKKKLKEQNQNIIINKKSRLGKVKVRNLYKIYRVKNV